MIFVSIASFRDKELIRTVKSCIAKAKHPENIRIGICWQYDEEEDLTALDNISQVESYKVYWKDVEGSVCWARSLVQEKFFNDEQYYFQIDSHTLFAQDWDELLIEMYKSLPTDKAVISVGPPYYYDSEVEGALPPEPWDENIETIENIHYETVIKKQKLDSFGGGFFMYGFLPAEDTSKPIPARHISAALLFTIGKWVREIPYDPNLYFHGEEGSLALRSFTNGYDLFNPNKFIVWHSKYRFPDRKRHWNTFDEQIVSKLQVANNERYQKIIRNELEGIYGLGSKRTLQDWTNYSGIDYINDIASEDAYKGITPKL
jgi:Glycosyltransferase (GlcNAc)